MISLFAICWSCSEGSGGLHGGDATTSCGAAGDGLRGANARPLRKTARSGAPRTFFSSGKLRATRHAVLHAFCATNAGGRCTTALTELYNSAQNVQNHYISGDVSFSTPTIFNGFVYMGVKTPSGATTSEIDVFGLCSNNGLSGCLD